MAARWASRGAQVQDTRCPREGRAGAGTPWPASPFLMAGTSGGRAAPLATDWLRVHETAAVLAGGGVLTCQETEAPGIGGSGLSRGPVCRGCEASPGGLCSSCSQGQPWEAIAPTRTSNLATQPGGPPRAPPRAGKQTASVSPVYSWCHHGSPGACLSTAAFPLRS